MIFVKFHFVIALRLVINDLTTDNMFSIPDAWADSSFAATIVVWYSKISLEQRRNMPLRDLRVRKQCAASEASRGLMRRGFTQTNPSVAVDNFGMRI